MHFNRPRKLAATLGIASLVAAAGCGGSSQSSGANAPIEIGGIFSLTGVNSTVSATYYHDMQLIVSNLNKQGGINGHKIKVTYANDNSDPAQGVVAYKKLVNQSHVKLIVGAIYSPVALAIAAQAMNDHVLLFSPGAVAPALTTPLQKYVFTAYPTAAVTSKVIVTLMQSLGLSKPGMVAEAGAYGDQAIAGMKKALQDVGLSLQTTQSIAADAIDATSQVVKFKNSGADVIVGGATDKAMTATIKAVFQQKLNLPIIANGGGSSAGIESLVTSSAPIDYYVASPLACPLDGQCASEFLTAYKAAYPKDSIALQTAQGYAAIQGFFAALKTAKGYSADEVVTAMENAPEYTNSLLPAPLKWSSTSHLGESNHFMEGFRDGKLYFFGNSVKENKFTG